MEGCETDKTRDGRVRIFAVVRGANWVRIAYGLFPSQVH